MTKQEGSWSDLRTLARKGGECQPRYDNYDAIEVPFVKDIPADYDGVMGVPVTFLNKYNPEQFEIIGTSDRGGDGLINHLYLPHDRRDAPVINGKGVYTRLFIRHRKPLAKVA
ncbi:adenine-specific methyltransferase EcoRI family protein [Endozoicomonas sp. 4G]|uniref:adenine-specific methyltransferase EcoRI family protein n=1 Tax=Endozoicomonas sp. 4G TaxID=2872754 RepID=UPI0020788B12|nr:adenine-specific methyltransferase EcoRI family protein [Endozoicomonas sp. 4G]